MKSHKGGGIEALILIDDRGRNTSQVIHKRDATFARLRERQIRTAGIENLFALTLNEKELELYDTLLGSLQTEYDTFADFDVQDAKANMTFPWRAYTLAGIAQTLNLQNHPEHKNYGSAALFSAVANCSRTSVENILQELSRGSVKHARIFNNYGKEPESDPKIGGAVFYNLNKNGPEFVKMFKDRLIELDQGFMPILQKYDDYIIITVSDMISNEIISFKQIIGERKNGPVFYNYLHVRGKKAEDASLYHFAGFSV